MRIQNKLYALLLAHPFVLVTRQQ